MPSCSITKSLWTTDIFITPMTSFINSCSCEELWFQPRFCFCMVRIPIHLPHNMNMLNYISHGRMSMIKCLLLTCKWVPRRLHCKMLIMLLYLDNYRTDKRTTFCESYPNLNPKQLNWGFGRKPRYIIGKINWQWSRNLLHQDQHATKMQLGLTCIARHQSNHCFRETNSTKDIKLWWQQLEYLGQAFAILEPPSHALSSAGCCCGDSRAATSETLVCIFLSSQLIGRWLTGETAKSRLEADVHF